MAALNMVQLGEAPDSIGARRIKHAYNLYSIRV